MSTFSQVYAVLRRNNRGRYALLAGCSFFSVLLITAYACMMRAPHHSLCSARRGRFPKTGYDDFCVGTHWLRCVHNLCCRAVFSAKVSGNRLVSGFGRYPPSAAKRAGKGIGHNFFKLLWRRSHFRQAACLVHMAAISALFGGFSRDDPNV